MTRTSTLALAPEPSAPMPVIAGSDDGNLRGHGPDDRPAFHAADSDGTGMDARIATLRRAPAERSRSVIGRLAVPVILSVLAAGSAIAQNQPITSPEDARCRDEARDQVFSAPNPNRLTPFDLGAEIYHACMRRLGAEPRPPRG